MSEQWDSIIISMTMSSFSKVVFRYILPALLRLSRKLYTIKWAFMSDNNNILAERERRSPWPAWRKKELSVSTKKYGHVIKNVLDNPTIYFFPLADARSVCVAVSKHKRKKAEKETLHFFLFETW